MELRPDASHKENVPPRPATSLRPGKRFSVDSREARLCSSASSSSAQGILPGREGGDGTPRERISREKERPASRNALQSKARNTVNLEPELGRWQWLSRCFRAWWRWAQRRRAVAAAVALGRRQLLRRGLRALRWALWLREAQLEAAWGRHTQALLARTFQKVRNLQIGAWRGSLREEAGAQPIPLCSGPRPDGGDRGVLILQALHQLAERMGQAGEGGPGRGLAGHAEDSEDSEAPPHLALSCCRCSLGGPTGPSASESLSLQCFGAWQCFVQRGTRYRAHVANRQAGTLRTCLQQWVQMKQLRASDGAKVAQLSLCWRKAGNMALFSSVPEGATVHGLRLMATARGMQRRALRHILRGWRLRARDAGSARIASAPDPLGGALGGEAPPGHSTHRRSSWDKASRAPALLEMLRLSFLCAVGRRQQGQCLLLWRARAQQSRDAARWHQSKLQRRILLGWSHWATAQGARRGLAARWAWNRRGRAALGLWRQRLVQRREVEWRARERGRRLQQRALGHWHCYWQRQVFLQEKCQRWVQARLQGLRRAVFWGWQQAAARRRPVAASPEQLLLQSHFQAWCGVVKASWAKRPAFQDGLRRRIPGTTFASEAQAATAQPRELRVARASCWRSQEQGCQADRQLRRTWAQQAFVARRVAPDLCCKAHRQAGESSKAQALCWMLWARESCQHRVLRDHAVPTLSARVLETWTQSATQGHVQRTAITHFQQAGPRRFLRTHWAQWRTALLRTRSCRPWAMGPSPTQHRSPSGRMRGEVSWAQMTASLLSVPPPSSSCRGPGVPAGPQASALQGQEGTAALRSETSRARKGIWGSQGRRPRPGALPFILTMKKSRKYLQCWRLEARLCQLQNSQQARLRAAMWQRWVDAQGAERLAWTLLRQWHLRWAWRLWRGRVLRLQVAQRLQRQEDGRVLSQAFNKWHQCLAASSSMRPWSKAGLRRPGSRPEAARAPALGGPGAEKGAQLQL
ncbi:hypothetical protein Celaphus_00010946 [Cervus elaphus hippelaphus]|uniref:Uncharacterized protein n=1 Tax=Cervus elaphus hippelaphus TaxID=46360 RepID=A0A212CQE3_CEREH|nr:hypothetical protein Celaphus_00010946 [Cervus elaphus hippelaphus]